jgi:branched-chain amino acid transport system substrate-binding protein
MQMKAFALAAFAGAALLAGTAFAQVQGVTKDEITVGIPIDLSGPLAEVGRAGANAARMAAEEVNDKGGIHGRKLKLLFEDQQYDAKKGVLATQKLLEQDKVFAILMATGTAPAAAAFPMVLKAGVPHVCPWTAAAMFGEPFERLSFACFPSNGAMIAAGTKYMVEKEGKKRFCYIYQDDDMGAEVKDNVEKVLAKSNLKIIEDAGYKRGATDFSAQVARVQRGNCDVLVLGAVPPAAAAILQEMERRSWKVTVLGAGPAFEDNTIKLGKEAVEGMWAVGVIPNPDPERSPPAVQDWMKRFQAKYNTPASLYAAYAYSFVNIMIEGLQKTGPNLTVDSFVKGMEQVQGYRTLFGSVISFSDKNRMGAAGAKLFRVQGGRWIEIGDLAPAS